MVVSCLQMDRENVELRESNKLLRKQVETLRSRLQALPVEKAREIHRISVQVAVMVFE